MRLRVTTKKDSDEGHMIVTVVNCYELRDWTRAKVEREVRARFLARNESPSAEDMKEVTAAVNAVPQKCRIKAVLADDVTEGFAPEVDELIASALFPIHRPDDIEIVRLT